ALTFQNHTDCPLTDFRGKTSIFSHPVYLFLRKFSLQDSRGGSLVEETEAFLRSALTRAEEKIEEDEREIEHLRAQIEKLRRMLF
ncbi:hypothetical protein GJ602_25730, partial [Escherichia coli]|nr:hypothetical protein [Escherichia coli]